jgi:hypothetical protein
VIVLLVGPFFSSVFTPETVAIIRSILSYVQFLATSMHIPLPGWPPQLLSFFRYIWALVDGIQLVSPECFSDSWSCARPLCAPPSRSQQTRFGHRLTRVPPCVCLLHRTAR